MNYESLGKVYYKEHEQYEEIYAARYHEPDTIHLQFEIHGNPAFLVSRAELWTRMLEIQRLNTEVVRLRGQLPGIALEQFTNRCLVDEIVLTNDIEGVSSTRREIHDVLEKLNNKKDQRPKRFLGLTRQYLRLRSKDTIPLMTCQDLRTLYDELVLPEVLEEDPADRPDGQYFRKEAVSVMSPSQKEIHQGLQPESAIISAMEQALAFLNDASIEPLLRVSAFHYLFGYIHPFYNGNGRLSRFISSYWLSQDLDPLVGYRLSYTIKEHIRAYYDAFKACNDRRNRGDITPFVMTFLEIIAEAMRQLREALQKRTVDFRHYEKLLEESSLFSDNRLFPIADLLLQGTLFSNDGISTQELLRYAPVSYMTLKKRLDEIEQHGYLLVQSSGREKRYRLDLERLEA